MTKHPFWSVGFRPFFFLACVAGAALPLWWVLIFTGAAPPAPTFVATSLQWHAHEMFYGFGWALLGGFLLTATKNWVGVRGWHGAALVFLAAAWLLDRVAMSFGAGWPPAVFWIATSLFQVGVVFMLMHTLLQQKISDGGSDNYFFWIALVLSLPAKFLILQGDYYVLGWSMSLAIFRLAFLLMLERTQVQFMRFGFQVDILRDPKLDFPIKWTAVALVFAELLPAFLAGALELACAALLLWRFAHWHPRKAFSRIDIGIMFLGYLMIVTQLAVSGIGRFVELPWVGTVSVHLFTVGVIGIIAPAMVVRISKGHTGREVVFDPVERFVLWLMIFGLFLRVGLPQVYPAGYLMSLHLAATCWLMSFVILLWRFTPFLLAPRVDGRPH